MSAFQRLIESLSPDGLSQKEVSRLVNESRRFLLQQTSSGRSLAEGDYESLNFKVSPQVLYGADIEDARTRHAAAVEARAEATSFLLGAAASSFISIALAAGTGGTASPAVVGPLLGNFQKGLELLK